MIKLKSILITAVLSSSAPFAATAQTPTYNHDPTKMNQITVGETGEGNLTPEIYYTMLHSNYKMNAQEQNKAAFRTAAYIAAYNQIKHSEDIDSVMKARSKIEALNMADRSGGVADLAWATESEKLTEKFNTLQNNINRLISMGASQAMRDNWIQKYNMLYSSLEIIRSAYLSNAQRKRQYLQIYKQTCRTNQLLVKQIASLNRNHETSKLLYGTSMTSIVKSNKANVVSESLRAWKTAAKND